VGSGQLKKGAARNKAKRSNFIKKAEGQGNIVPAERSGKEEGYSLEWRKGDQLQKVETPE